MVAYSFKKRFAGPIEAGIIDGTIRADRKRHAYPGETMELYVSMRTARCRLLGAPRCIAVNPITLDFQNDRVELGGTTLTEWVDLHTLARADGFEDWAEMRGYWAENHPATPVFSGIHLRWDRGHFQRRAAA